MPESFPDYPGNRQILRYTRDFANAYGLWEAIRFRTAVDTVERNGDAWAVPLDEGSRHEHGRGVCDGRDVDPAHAGASL